MVYMWDLPIPSMELVSSALAGGFFTTEPSGKPLGNDSNVSNLSLRTEKGNTSGFNWSSINFF